MPRKTRDIIQTARFGVSLAATLLVTLAAAGQESTVPLSGTVIDAEGKPVADAAVIVAEGPDVFRAWRDRSRGVAVPALLGKATSASSGMFTVDLAGEAAEFSGRRTRLTVWAYHAGAAVSVRLIDRDWLAARLPLRLELERMLNLLELPNLRFIYGLTVLPLVPLEERRQLAMAPLEPMWRPCPRVGG